MIKSSSSANDDEDFYYYMYYTKLRYLKLTVLIIAFIFLCFHHINILAFENKTFPNQFLYLSSKSNFVGDWPKEVDKVNALTQELDKKKAHAFRFQKNFGIGINLMLPELYPIEIFWFINNYFALKVFFAPAHKFNIIVELERDVISTKKGWIIEHPDLEIKFKLLYGEHYGSELYFFPFASSFYIASGISSRKISVRGDVNSPILFRPSGTPEEETLTSRTIFYLGANTETSAVLMRASIGFLKLIQSKYYFNFYLAGIVVPKTYSQSVNTFGHVDSPVDEFEDIEDLRKLKEERLSELDSKILKKVKEYNQMPFIIFGLGLGLLL